MSAGRLHAKVGSSIFTCTPDTDVPSAVFPQIVGEPGWTSQVDETDLWPSWRSAVAQVSLMFDTAAAATAAGVVKGGLCHMAWSEDPANTTRAGTDLTFEGQITDVQVSPTTFRDLPCVRVDVTAADYATAHLGAIFPSGTLPAQNAQDRLTALVALSGEGYVVPAVPIVNGVSTSLNPTMTALVLDGSRSLYDLLQEHTRIYPLDFRPTFAGGLPGTGGAWPEGCGLGRYYIAPQWNAGTGPLAPLVGAFFYWGVGVQLKDVDPTRLPGYLGSTPDIAPGTWGVLIPETGAGRGDCTVASDKVELGAGWSDRVGLLPNAIKVNSPALAWETWNGDSPRQTQAVDAALLNDVQGVLSLADTLLPEEGSSRWWPDTMVWRIDKEAVPSGRGTWPRFGELVTIMGLPSAFQPDGKPWMVGTLIRYAFKMARGSQPQMELTIKPQLRDILRHNGITEFGTFDNAPTGLTMATANTVFTFDDLRLAKGGIAP